MILSETGKYGESLFSFVAVAPIHIYQNIENSGSPLCLHEVNMCRDSDRVINFHTSTSGPPSHAHETKLVKPQPHRTFMIASREWMSI
jgi:hypothetical protein